MSPQSSLGERDGAWLALIDSGQSTFGGNGAGGQVIYTLREVLR